MSQPSTASTDLIEWLGEARSDAGTMGGKAASLDRLARLGFLIPPGFSLTTAAFHVHLSTISADVAVRQALGALPEESARESVAAAVRDSPLHAPVAEALRLAVDRLVAAGERSFAVRSSAIGEDGQAASYAGLHDTELGVGPDDVAASVARCWASLWSPAAVAYRQRRGHRLDDAAMAVVVQALVPADAAAVVFTRHPVTGRMDQVLVNAVRGLGEPMVSGMATPDEIVIDKSTGATVAFMGGDGGERLIATDSGVSHTMDPATGPALAGAVLRDLVELSLRVERAIEAPVDIEAAFARGRWYVLQSRPITT
jgi:phosphoenolpyruvate synthase/pyruvate phosphate dikinase